MKKNKIQMNGIFLKIFAIALLFKFTSSCDKDVIGDDTPQRVSGVHDIIPLPKRIDFFNAYLTLSNNTTISASQEFELAAKVLEDELNEIGISSSISSGNDDAHIVFFKDTSLSTEETKIVVDENQIVISANSNKGAFYAAQSLRQYFWTSSFSEDNSTLKVKSTTISDQPENAYRGFHIDVARHFFPKEFIFKVIDQMALYKLNTLQLHLSDDQGWRIPIDKYPDLINIGSSRDFDKYDLWCKEQAVHDSEYNFDPNYVSGNTYHGHYSKQDLREIVAYAAENYIEVIPELDMPGHMTAAIRAYPWIAGGSIDWGSEFSKPMWVWDEKVMQFAKDVWDEVIEIFPSATVHIGADEVEKSFWEESEDCKNFMAENNMTHVNMVQSYFVDEITKYLEGKGKKVIAWDDVMVSNDDDIVNIVSPSIDIMYWRNYKEESSVYAARNGNNIILTPWDWFYISSANTDENLIRMYNFNESTELNPIVVEKKKGYQACIWTEHIPSEAVFEKFVFPRLQAFSEVAWSKGKNFDSFKRRLGTHLDYMENENINFRTPNFMK